MKREIICKVCKECQLKPGKKYSSYPNEHIKSIGGYALYNYRCDLCGKEILVGEWCCAVSMWLDGAGIPYYSWEQKFIREN